MNKSINERVALWRQFYARKNESPLFGFFVGSEYPVARYDAAKSLPEGRALVLSDFDWIFSKLPPQGLAVNTVVESPGQAQALLAKYQSI